MPITTLEMDHLIWFETSLPTVSENHVVLEREGSVELSLDPSIPIGRRTTTTTTMTTTIHSLYYSQTNFFLVAETTIPISFECVSPQ